jgi:hypothetical protein
VTPRRAVVVVAVVLAAMTGSSTMRSATASRASCAGDSSKPLVHTAAANREATLTGLFTTMAVAADRYALNAAQRTALATARVAVSDADARVQRRADVAPIFEGARVYWLRLPQTKEIEAADRLAVATATLQGIATELAAYAHSGTAAGTALTAMRAKLSTAEALLGTPPVPAPDLATVASLAPAKDMTNADASLRSERADLLLVYDALAAAKAEARRAVTALRG